MRNDYESNYLAHHGILGQKWGKRNGPPYPLDASDHSASEKKAGWRKSLGNGEVSKKSKLKKAVSIAGKVAEIHKEASNPRTDGPTKESSKKEYENRKNIGYREGPIYEQMERSEKMKDKTSVKDGSNNKIKEAKNVFKSDSGSRKSKALTEARKKDIDEMTTQELRETNARLREEKSYQELTKGTTAEGKRFVKELGKNIAAGIITGIAIEAGKRFVKSKLGI